MFGLVNSLAMNFVEKAVNTLNMGGSLETMQPDGSKILFIKIPNIPLINDYNTSHVNI